jgi:glycolate oxidase
MADEFGYKDYLISPPISEEKYQALEAIVGPEFITREPAVLDGYAWQPLWNKGPEMYIHRPIAVVLPANTEEVQAIVRVCNEMGIPYKAFSTGWGVFAGCKMENEILIELRRMDKIIEIDEKNMYIVVEPHAIGGQIIAECMARGLHCHIVSSGPASSPLASATSFCGTAPDGTYMNWSPRNLMGVEWVLPDGEIVRLGSLGSSGDWFSGDGPGPSLRGVLRGRLGAMGGNGVFTKVALKLYNWPCQPKPEPDGFLYDTELPLPPNCKVYTLFFPDRNSMADATQAITVEGVGYNAFKPGMGSMLGIAIPHLLHKESWRNSKGLKTLIHDFNHLFMEILVTDSPEELDFQESVIREEVARHGGIMVDMEPIGMAEFSFWTFMLATAYPIFFRPAGMFITAYGQDESHHSMVAMSPKGEDIKRKYIKEGSILDDGSDSGIHFMMEESTCSHYEEPVEFDHRDYKQASAILPFETEFNILQVSCCMEPGNTAPDSRVLFGPAIANYQKWQKMWANSINPNKVADDYYYAADPIPGKSVSLKPELLKQILEMSKNGAWGPDGPPD